MKFHDYTKSSFRSRKQNIKLPEAGRSDGQRDGQKVIAKANLVNNGELKIAKDHLVNKGQPKREKKLSCIFIGYFYLLYSLVRFGANTFTLL